MSDSAWELVTTEETLNIFTWRLRIPGGWLYRRGNTDRMIFVEDPEFRTVPRRGEDRKELHRASEGPTESPEVIRRGTHYWVRVDFGSTGEEVGLPHFDGDGELVTWGLIGRSVPAGRVTVLRPVR